MVRRNFKKPHRAKRKKPLFAKAGFWKVVGLFSLIGGAVWFFCFSSALEVKEINVSGAQKINGGDCAKIIEDEVNKKIAFFGSRSILLFNLESTKKDILARFPQVQDIKIKVQYPSKIYASIEERREVAIVVDANGGRYSLDNDGIAFETAAQDLKLLEIISQNNQRIDLGTPAIKKELLSDILRMKAEAMSSAGIEVVSAEIISAERVNLLTFEGWYVYYNPLKSVDEQIVKLAAVANDESFKPKRQNLEYLDIRFTRVYLKEKQPAVQEAVE